MKLLAISGSLRKQSINTAVLHAAVQLAPRDTDLMIYDGLAELPHFNPDLDTDQPPASVIALRMAIDRCGGLLLCSPEYARGVPGSLKNALDWLVGSSELPGKPTAVINASNRATHADAQLRLILATMSAQIVEEASITLPLHGRRLSPEGIVADVICSEHIRNALNAFARAVRTHEKSRPP